MRWECFYLHGVLLACEVGVFLLLLHGVLLACEFLLLHGVLLACEFSFVLHGVVLVCEGVYCFFLYDGNVFLRMRKTLGVVFAGESP